MPRRSRIWSKTCSIGITVALTIIAATPFGRIMKKALIIWRAISHAARAPALRVRASFSQERMAYIPANDSSAGVSKVIFQSKDETSTKTFEALDWLAQLVTHIPNKGESRRCREFVITDSTQISRGDYGKRPARMTKFRYSRTHLWWFKLAASAHRLLAAIMPQLPPRANTSFTFQLQGKHQIWWWWCA